MATPSKKSPGMEAWLEQAFGRTTAITNDVCVDERGGGCSQPAPPESFRDEKSAREYTISGLCQQCQDKVWP